VRHVEEALPAGEVVRQLCAGAAALLSWWGASR
jgi:hypothetical protein